MNKNSGAVVALLSSAVDAQQTAQIDFKSVGRGAPLLIVRNFQRTSGFEEGDPYVYIECVQTIYAGHRHRV